MPSTLPSDWTLSPGSRLVFALSPVDEKLPDDDKGKDDNGKGKRAETKEKADPAKEKAKAEARKNQRLDLSVELQSGAGVTVRLPLAEFRAVPVLLQAKLSKFRDESAIYAKPAEPVLQSFELPLAAFVRADSRFDPATLTTIRLVFDKSKEGVIALDDVGITVR